MSSTIRQSDLLLAAFVIGITALLLVPLPTTLLDLLLVTNLSFSLVLLLAGLYMPNALALLAFPSLLLLTTIFRLGLNVASTRLILSQADAGRVIEAFGTFLIRGEVVVGLIIFTIITIVNFIVIARGSSRVSEVAARFALDALPGKQMAIDADLRAGLLSAEEAQRKREELRKESQLYGAMDGAMKFVQGDAVAGFFIILTNILGGIYVGLRDGMLFIDAVQTYTTLTVGDGLVNQIPAILISVCAGIVVTRVSSGENSSLGADLGEQLFARPGTIIFAGGLLIFLGCLPALPFLPFFLVGAVMVGSALWMRRAQHEPGPRAVSALLEGPKSLALPAIAVEEGVEPQVTVALDANLLHRLYRDDIRRYRQWWSDFQSDFYQEHGLRLPEVRVVSSELATANFQVLVNGILCDEGSVPLDALLVEVNPDSADLFGLEIIEASEHPGSGARIFWARRTHGLERVLNAANVRHFDFFQYIALRLGKFFRGAPEEVLTLSDIHILLKELEKKYPSLTIENFGRQLLSESTLVETLQQLVREGISIRDFKQIIEHVASYCANLNGQESSIEVGSLVEHVRQMRKRHITASLMSYRRSLRVITLSTELEDALLEVPYRRDNVALAIEPGLFEDIRASLNALLNPIKVRGILPVTVLCPGELRHLVSSLVQACQEVVGVVTFDELELGVSLEPVGIWGKGGV